MQKYSKSMCRAVIQGDVERVNKLLSFGIKADIQGPKELHHNSYIHLASYNKNFEVLASLVNSLTDKERRQALIQPNLHGANSLHEAVWISRPPNQTDTKEYIDNYNNKLESMPRVFSLLLSSGASSGLTDICDISGGTREDMSFSVCDFIKYQLRKNNAGELINCRENAALLKCFEMINRDKESKCEILSLYQKDGRE